MFVALDIDDLLLTVRILAMTKISVGQGVKNTETIEWSDGNLELH